MIQGKTPEEAILNGLISAGTAYIGQQVGNFVSDGIYNGLGNLGANNEFVKNVTSEVVSTVGVNYGLTYGTSRFTGKTHQQAIQDANRNIGPSFLGGTLSGVSKTIFPDRFGRGNKNNDNDIYEDYYGNPTPLEIDRAPTQLNLDLLPKPQIKPIPPMTPTIPCGSFQMIMDRWVWVPCN